MSNHLAIATVTATLFNILDAGKEESGTAITTRPPDKARDSATGNQLNIFLYHTAINESLRNEPPRQVKQGESGHPPLPLRLFYLVTAYGAHDDEIAAHRVLGRAMANLNDRPLLGREEFKGANATLAGSDLHQQIERVRVTPEPLSLDDMFKLWSSFQTQYRPSAAYQVSVVLIDSGHPARAPLPVLKRGEDDRGAAAQADLVPPFPTLTGVLPPPRQPAARLGDTVTLTGHHLAGDQVEVHFKHPRRGAAIVLTPQSAGDSELTVTLPVELPPAAAAGWLAGVYLLSALIRRAGEPDRTTNEWPLAVAPTIRKITRATRLRIRCEHEVLAEQKPTLLLGERVIAAHSIDQNGTRPRFPLTDVPAGEYLVRLRVDGIDSLAVDYSQTPPVFDPAMKVILE